MGGSQCLGLPWCPQLPLGHEEPCNNPSPWGPAALMVPTVSLLRAEDAASHNLLNVFKEKKMQFSKRFKYYFDVS